MIYVITKLDIYKQRVEIVASYNTLESAKAYLYDINEYDEVSVKKKEDNHIMKVYQLGYFGKTPTFIYEILKLNHGEKKTESKKDKMKK